MADSIISEGEILAARLGGSLGGRLFFLTGRILLTENCEILPVLLI